MVREFNVPLHLKKNKLFLFPLVLIQTYSLDNNDLLTLFYDYIDY